MLLILALVIASSLPAVNGQEAQKPVVDALIRGENFHTADTLTALVKTSDGIVVARVVSTKDRSSAKPKRFRTEYTLVVVDALRPHPQLVNGVGVCRPGGAIEYPDHILRYDPPGTPKLSDGREYLLFLRWNEDTNCFWPVDDGIGILAVAGDGRLEPLKAHRANEGLRGVSKAQLRSRLPLDSR